MKLKPMKPKRSADRAPDIGAPTDEPNPAGSLYARLAWWKARADEDADEIERLRAKCAELLGRIWP